MAMPLAAPPSGPQSDPDTSAAGPRPAARSAEVSRLEDLGATIVCAHPALTVMQDPEGNEFCVEPGPEDWCSHVT